MINYNIRYFAYLILGLAFCTYSIIFGITQNLESIDFNLALKHVTTTISINLILWLIFIKWGWKFRIFHRWLVPFPDLNGTWIGTIKSNFDKKRNDTIQTELNIFQTFFNIQIKIKTEESSSYSIGASFDIDKERGLQQLFYSYLNTPKASVRNRSEIHYGSTRLEFEGNQVKKMSGEYWTSRETTGHIEVEKNN